MAARHLSGCPDGPPLEFPRNVGEVVESPRGAAADTEPEDFSGEEFEGATTIRFRTKSTWKHINHFTVDGKSETDISNLIFESAKEAQWMTTMLQQ